MLKSKLLKTSVLMGALVFSLTACSNANAKADKNTDTPIESEVVATTVEITDAHGTYTVPVNPEKVVSLDSRSFETLEAWGVKLAAAPKGVMPKDSAYVTDETVQDIGNHREPNLEIIAAIDPDVVIVGQRFAGFYEDIKALVPNAVVLDVNFDVSETAEDSGKNLVDGFKKITSDLGKIFDKNDEASALIDNFDSSIETAKKAYNGTDKMMTVIVSGGNIGYSAPGHGRVWGPLYNILGWTPAISVDNTTTDHQGDEISVEAIAQSNPDWMFVLDRDGGTASGEESTPAKDVIDNSPALTSTTAIVEGNIAYAPVDTYTNESIQTFIEIFDIITENLSK